MKSSYAPLAKIWKATTGNVGLSPAAVLNFQYWLTLIGSLGKGKGARARADFERRGIGGTVFSISSSFPPVRGILSCLMHSQSTTLLALYISSAKRLSSLKDVGSLKMMSKTMTAAPPLTKFSVRCAYSERGHFCIFSGRLRFATDALSIPTTTTSNGAFLT